MRKRNLKNKRQKIFSLIIAVTMVLGMFILPVTPVYGEEDTLDRPLIPQPTSYVVSSGKFVLTKDTSIYVKGSSDSETNELKNIGELLAQVIRTSTGYSIKVVKGDAQKGDIQLTTVGGDSSLGDEGYTLTTTADGVKVVAAKPAGVYRGSQTIRQLLPADIEKSEIVSDIEWNMPVSSITDSPRYDYRGTHLDVARHFRTVEEVKRHIDNIAQYKINVLHLHLTDDQGWRLEMKGGHTDENGVYESYEKLITIGAQSSCNGDPGGYYTQEEYKDIVAYAAKRYIEIVPEFDMPGHTGAALASLDFLSPNGKPLDAPTQDYDVGKTTFDCKQEATYEFIEDMIKQMSELSPSKYIHIGGDEAHSTSKEDYNYFMSRVTEIAKKYGKIPMGWQNYDQTEGTDNSVVQFWGTSTGASIANPNMKILMSPANKAYLDMQYPTNGDWGLSWAGKISIQAGYEWDPTDYKNFNQDNIIGIEAPLWSETINSVEGLDHLAFPRMLGYAEIGWSAKENRNWDNYKERLVAHAERLTNEGIGFYRDPQVFGLPTYNDPITIPAKFDTYLTGLADGMSTSYKINAQKSGTYMVELNYSTDGIWSVNGQKIALSIDGEKVDEKKLAVTWSGHGAVIMPITVSEGEHTLKLDFIASNYSLNYINIYEAPIVEISSRVEAEDYINSYGVNHEPQGSRYNVSETNTGDWLEYAINVSKAGTYTLALNSTSQSGNATADIYVDNEKVGSLTSATTGSWSNYVTQEASNEFELTEGKHTLKIAFTEVNDGTNIDYLVFTDVNKPVVPDELNVYFDLNEGTGSIITSQNGTHTAKINGNIIWDEGYNDTGLKFEGDGYVDLGIDDINGPWTIGLWVKRGISTQSNAVLVSGNAGELKLDQWNATGKVGLTEFGVADYVFDYSAPIGEWVHLTFVCDQKSTSLYVNGEYKDQIQAAIAMPGLRIGANAKTDLSDSGNIVGTLDEIKLFNKALSADEVKGLIDIHTPNIDKSGLENKIAEIEAIDLDQYISTGKDVLASTLQDAKAILAKEDATQEEINTAINSLNDALSALVKKADKTALNSAIETAKTIDLTKYEEDGQETFKSALQEAIKVADNKDALEADVISATKSLVDAQNALVAKSEKPEGPVKPVDSEKPGENNQQNPTVTKPNESTNSKTKTGDETNLYGYAAVMLIVAGIFAILKKKKIN